MNIITVFVGLVGLTCLASHSSAVQIKPVTRNSTCLTAAWPGGDWAVVPANAACNGAANQNWALDPVPGLDLYTFSTSTSCSSTGKVIEAQGTGNAAPVTQVDFDPTHKTAYWNRITLGSSAQAGYYFYQNVGSGRCLTADVAGNPVTTWDCIGDSAHTHQLWNVQGTAVKNQLFSANCLDVKYGLASSGATITTNVCDANSVSQDFTVASKNPIMLHNAWSGKCVDGGVGDYILVTYQFSCVSNAGNQQWMQFQFPGENNPNGFYYFMNMLTGKCLTLLEATGLAPATGSLACAEGNALQQWLVV